MQAGRCYFVLPRGHGANGREGLRSHPLVHYLIGEKLIAFARAAERDAAFAMELPRFLAAIWRVFNQYEIAGYVASQKPAVRKNLQSLLYVR